MVAFVAVVLLLGVVLAACGESGPASAGGTLKAGLAFTTTGPSAALGDNVANGTRLAIKVVNDRGGLKIGGKSYKIESAEYSTDGKPDVGVSVSKKLIEQDQVQIIFGDCISTVALAQQPVIEKAAVPWITMASHADLTKDRKWTFRSNNIMTA